MNATLVRTGKLVERVKEHVTPLVNSKPSSVPNVTDNYGSNAAANTQDYHVLRPISRQEIDRTSGGITQNLGCPQ